VEVNPDLMSEEIGNKAVDLALTKLGTPYSQKKRNQKGYFDCSSFTYWIYSQLGVILQHGGSNTAASQERYILSVKIRSLKDISVKADVKGVNGNTSKENLCKCKIQGKYVGTVTDIHKGTVFVRLYIGVNAVVHSCYDNRMPGKKDDVSFVVTRIDADRNVAVGLISRIIKQNI
jgi:hypothetical protein